MSTSDFREPSGRVKPEANYIRFLFATKDSATPRGACQENFEAFLNGINTSDLRRRDRRALLFSDQFPDGFAQLGERERLL